MVTGDLLSSNDLFKEFCLDIRKSKELNNRLLLINCPQFNFRSYEKEVAKSRCYYAYPPVGLLNLAQAVEDRGIDVKILDMNYELLKSVSKESLQLERWTSLVDKPLREFNPSMVGISNFFIVDSQAFVSLARYVREKGDYLILAGGQNATYNAKRFLDDGVCDVVCERESENKIKCLMDNLLGKGEIKPVSGIIFNYEGKVERTSGEPDIVVPKGSLSGVYGLINVEDYCNVGSLSPYSRMAGKNKKFATFLLNRGCHARCEFCDVTDFMGRGVRSREISDVLNEVEYLHREKGIEFFELLDDDFGRYKERAKQLCQGIIDKGLKISWASNNGMIAQTIDEELMQKMRDSGCTGFKIGVESGNPERLRKIRKPGTVKSFMEFSRIAQKFPEMFVVDNYIFGFPDEPFKDILDSFNFSRKMNLDWSNYTVYQHNVKLFGVEGRDEKNIGDFVPTKDSFQGKVSSDKDYLGPKIFELPLDRIPSKEQLHEMWFASNLIRNFVMNKNWDSEKGLDKLVSWISTIQERYPTHPYMNLFLTIAYGLKGNGREREIQQRKTLENLKDSYWRERFGQFELNEISSNFPVGKNGARESINYLRAKYEVYLR